MKTKHATAVSVDEMETYKLHGHHQTVKIQGDRHNNRETSNNDNVKSDMSDSRV